MKLIYLWIEKYKNIENQGFKFTNDEQIEVIPVNDSEFNVQISPRDSDYKSIYSIDNRTFAKHYSIPGGQTLIRKRSNQNIDITCLVGENGSGKTAIMECIYSIDMVESSNEEQEGMFEIKYFKIYKDNNNYYYPFSCAQFNFKININNLNIPTYRCNHKDGGVIDTKYTNIVYLKHNSNSIPYSLDFQITDFKAKEVDISYVYDYLCDNYKKYYYVTIQINFNKNTLQGFEFQQYSKSIEQTVAKIFINIFLANIDTKSNGVDGEFGKIVNAYITGQDYQKFLLSLVEISNENELIKEAYEILKDLTILSTAITFSENSEFLRILPTNNKVIKSKVT